MNAEENGFISRHEIKTKFNELLFHGGIRANALRLKGMVERSVNEGGSSLKNLTSFVEQLKST